MLIHFMCAAQKILKMIHADEYRDRQTDRRPQRVAPAHPIPEFEHMRGVYAEFFYFRGVGGNRHKMPCDR